MRGSNIPMVEKFGGGGQERVNSAGLNAAAERRIDDRTAQDGVEGDLERMLVKARHNLEPLRRMMQLVAKAPEQLRIVPQSVPPIINKGRKQIGDEGRIPV